MGVTGITSLVLGSPFRRARGRVGGSIRTRPLSFFASVDDGSVTAPSLVPSQAMLSWRRAEE